MDKSALSERDICTKYITPAIEKAGWNLHSQVREEFTLTRGRIIVRGRLHSRGKSKRADYEEISRRQDAVQDELKRELMACLGGGNG